MANFLITGGAGFIGSHLADELVKNNHDVVIVDDFSNGNIENLKNCKESIEVINFDVSNTDWGSLNKLNPDTIFHLATHPRSFSLNNPIRNLEVNVLGTLNTLEFAKKKNSRVIYTSNSGICGDPQFFPITEEHPEDCKTPYDANKLVGEHYAKIYHKIYDVYTTIFRLSTVYGERQKINDELAWRPLVPSFVEKLETGSTPIIQWDGEQTRDMIYVKDVIDCLILGAKSNDHGGEMFLLSTNTETSVNKVFEIASKITGKNVKPYYKDALPGDLRRMVLSYEKAKKAFGYSPKFELTEGIKKYVEWYRSQ